ncbi:hypothetical protein Avbf_10216 [Armadillidium vulgare]|nr:hypothetical protein Avbf_10216 [Armadillidium vulgare]
MEDNFAIQTLSTQENVAGVKARLRKEGREARNLIAYSLPLGSWKISFSSSTNEKDIEKLNKIPDILNVDLLLVLQKSPF